MRMEVLVERLFQEQMHMLELEVEVTLLQVLVAEEPEAGGGDHASGGGGYTGGCGQPEIARADNGLTANLTPFYGTGGAYFSSGKTSGNYLSNPETFAYIGGQGSQCSDWNSQGGDGGIAGQGGNIKVSEHAKIYAYNGNKYTDGTEYRNGENQLEIY